MENNIPISDEAFNKLVDGIEKGNFWLLYDNKKLLLDPADVDQFKSKGDAFLTIARKEINDDRALIYAPTIQDVLRQIPYGNNINHISSSQNKSVMNQENLKFLQDRLFYLGTEKRLHPELEKNMAEGKPEFKLSFSNHHDKDKLSAELHLRKSETNDMYFLNKYDATLQKPGQESKSQTFYLENGKGVTMKEAYNLLDGRSVNRDLKNKEGEVKNAWIKLDFSNKEPNGNFKQEQFYKPYGFDLQTELFKLPLPQMHSEKFNQMVESLERGNTQKVNLPENIIGAPSPITIQANPKFKTIDIMDESGRPLSKVEKNDLYALGEQRNKMRDEALSSGTLKGIDSRIYFFDPNIKQDNIKTESLGQKDIVEHSEKKLQNSDKKSQNPENIVEKYKAEKGIPKNDGTIQKTAKASSKKDVESLLPKKHSSHKKGLAI